MQTSVVAVAITYHPDDAVIGNLLSYYFFVEKLIVIDNTENANTDFLQKISTYENMIVIKNGSNEGISASLNKAAGKAIELNAGWLLTMDQDSSFTEPAITRYLNCFEKIRSEKLGMLGVNYIGETNGNDCTTLKKDSLITSGSLLNLAAYKKTGSFNEDLFIDGVDDEYCFRLIMAGFDVMELPNVSLVHSLGKVITVKNWNVGKLVQRNIHPPIRIYYMTRNYLYLIKKYKKQFPDKAVDYKRELLVKIKNSLLYSKKRILVLQYILKAIVHFRRGKFGKLDQD